MSRPRTGEQTIGDVLQLLLKGEAGRNNQDRLVKAAHWPPDVFAVTSVLLSDSGAYRLAVSPHDGGPWPPDESWAARIESTASSWREGALTSVPVPARIQELCTTIA